MALVLPTADEIKKIVNGWQYNVMITGSGYVAPTVYLKAGQNVGAWNYYSSKEAALKHLYYLAGEKGYTKQTASGYVSFKRDGTAQTFGINCDFFLPVKVGNSIPVPYAIMRELIIKGKINLFLVRMYTPDGKGPVWSVFSTSSLNIAATVVKATGEKLAVMESHYRNLAKIKSEYNNIVASLNSLSQKPFDPVTQGIINRLTQRRISMYEQIQSITGITIATGSTPQVSGVGFVPIAYIVVLALIGVTGWGITTWIKEEEKSARITTAFNHQKYMVEEQKKLTADYNAGKITKEQYELSMKNIGVATKTAQTVAEQSSEPEKGLLEGAGNIAMWLAIGLIGVTVLKNK